MKRHLLRALLPLALLAACSDSEGAPPTSAAETPQELARLLSAVVAEQQARPEHTTPEVTIQQLLVAVQGGGAHGAEKTATEAAALAAELFARARNDEDFDTLVKNFSDDVHPGVYVMALDAHASPPAYPRASMTVAGLGDVAWRLAVGEIGVAAFDGDIPGQEPRSPLGYHLIKRLK